MRLLLIIVRLIPLGYEKNVNNVYKVVEDYVRTTP